MSSDKPAWMLSRQLCDQLGEPDEIILELIGGVAQATAFWHDGLTDISVTHHDRDGDTYDLGEDGRGQRPRPLPATVPAELRNRISQRTARALHPQVQPE